MKATIRIRRVERPYTKDLDADLRWLCASFGFCDPTTPESTASRIFREVVRATRQGQGITSTQLAEDVDMSRGAVINHLNNLLDAGLISKHGTRYTLRAGNIHRTIAEIQRDMARIFEDLDDMAAEIDRELGFKRRE